MTIRVATSVHSALSSERVIAKKSHDFGVVAVLWENLVQLPKTQSGHSNTDLLGRE